MCAQAILEELCQCVHVGKLMLFFFFFIQILLSSDGSQWFRAAGNLS